MNKWPYLICSALGLSVVIGDSAHAGLAAVDPGPYTLATGRYPLWYEDPDGLALELCQSKAISPNLPAGGTPNYLCTIIPDEGYDDRLPMVFPDNWPHELFWQLVEAQIPGNNYELETYVAGLEAAFGQDEPVDGDQVSFARIRLRVTIPTTGVYTITHPYGVETINVTSTGRRAINMTRDIGIGAPGDFTGPLGGDLGPFLRSVNGPYTAINPETGESETFVGDPNLSERVTGSPFNSNFIRIEGPAGVIQTDLFSVSGKVYDRRSQTALEIERSTYRRDAGGTSLELFASAPNSATLCYRESLELVGGTPPSPCLVNLTADNNGRFFARQSPSAGLPPFLVVTARNDSGASKPTSTSTRLVDLVKVHSARYSWADRSLVIEARSSDEVNVPDLVAQGYGRLSKTGTLQRLVVSDLDQPPAGVTVKSSAGGSDNEPVLVVGQAPEQPQEPGDPLPIARNDSVSTAFASALTFNVLGNDSDPDGGALSIVELSQPPAGQGSVALGSDGLLTYTPPQGLTTALTTSFSYRVQNTAGQVSAPATVTVSVAANQPPLAVADSGATQGQVLQLNVLGNDSDPENHPLSIASLTQPGTGQGSVSSNGSVLTYTPPASSAAPFTATFSYVAQDSFGALSQPATVTVQVSPPPPPAENLQVTAASVTARLGGRYSWDLSGTTSVTSGNSVTVQVTTANGLVTIGSVTVPASGRWRLLATGTVAPSASPTATVRTSLGTQQTVPVTVR